MEGMRYERTFRVAIFKRNANFRIIEEREMYPISITGVLSP